MKREDELILKTTKEIVVKFIEVGRLSVSSFEEVWNNVYASVDGSIKKQEKEP